MDSSAAGTPAAPKPGFSVGELCRLVDDTISATFPDEVWVRGVISGIKRSANGHVYFDLIDPGDLGHSPEATLPVALFATARQRVNAILRKTNAARMEDGVEIRIRGQVAYYPRQGRVQLIMSLIDPAHTLGQLEAAKAELLGQLAAEGLLDANRLVQFPALPLRVGLVTSSGSAAEADFLNELHLSGYPFTITLFDSRVQGTDAVAELAAAIAVAQRDDIDILAIVRGGGARTDLAAFDHAEVARAIARCSLPVVVGVGHEIDESVADRVAARSAKTPTACAALLVEAVRSFHQRVERCRQLITKLAKAQMDSHQRNLGGAGTRLSRVSAQAVARHRTLLEVADSRLTANARRVIERAGHGLATATVRVDALDPQVALARGWSMTQTSSGMVVRSVADVPLGTELITTVADGRIASTSHATHVTGPDQDQGTLP